MHCREGGDREGAQVWRGGREMWSREMGRERLQGRERK